MKKIVFCMPHIVMGGTEKVLCEYVVFYKKHNIDVDIISIKKVTDSFFLDLFKQLFYSVF